MKALILVLPSFLRAAVPFWGTGCRWVLATAGLAAAVAVGCNASKLPSGVDLGDVDAGPAGNAPQAIGRRICDGSPEIRFAFGYAPGTAQPYTAVLADLGTDFLYVDGECRYWVQQPGSIPDEYRLWRSIREGVLTPDQETGLHAAVGYDDFSAAPACANSEGRDTSIARMWDGRRVYVCTGGGLQVSADWPLRAELYASASPVSGAVRIQVGKTPVLDNALVYDWPLDGSPEDYLVEEGEARSFRVDDPAAVAALQSLRERATAAAGLTPGYFHGAIGIDSTDYALEADLGFVLSVRDDLPFTNSDGMWSPP